jgi:hypothetical protein
VDWLRKGRLPHPRYAWMSGKANHPSGARPSKCIIFRRIASGGPFDHHHRFTWSGPSGVLGFTGQMAIRSGLETCSDDHSWYCVRIASYPGSLKKHYRGLDLGTCQDDQAVARSFTVSRNIPRSRRHSPGSVAGILASHQVTNLLCPTRNRNNSHNTFAWSGPQDAAGHTAYNLCPLGSLTPCNLRHFQAEQSDLRNNAGRSWLCPRNCT